MNTKKALIIGGLSALLIGLTAFAIQSKDREQKKQEIESKYSNKLKPTRKNKIQTNTTTSGYTYDINPLDNSTELDPITDNTYNKYPTEYTYNYPKPTSLYQTNWVMKEECDFQETSTEFYVNFISGNSQQFQTIAVSEYGLVYGEWDGQSGYDYTLAYRTNIEDPYNDELGWQSEDYMYIFFQGGQDQTKQELIDLIYNNANIPLNKTYLASEKTETINTTFNSISYRMMNQKQFENNFTEYYSEGLFLIRINTPQMLTDLFLTDAQFYTGIPNMYQNSSGSYPQYTAQIKISKLTNLDLNTKDLFKTWNSYESYYNNLQNKTNIYSGKYTWNSSSTNNSWQNGTYSEEQGTRIATFGNANPSPNWIGGLVRYDMNWKIENIEQSIKSQAIANYIAIYYNVRLSNFIKWGAWNVDYLDWRVGYVNYFKGYALSEHITTPPDIEDGNFTTLTGMMLDILTMPFTFIVNAFNITLWEGTPWAFNIRNFIMTVIAIMSFLFIIKLFTSGFSVMGNFTGNNSKNALNRSQTKLNKEKAKTEKAKRESSE